MRLYRNKKRGPREFVGGIKKIGGVATCVTRELSNPDLYPPGPFLQFNFSDETSLEASHSLEIDPKEGDRLLARLIIFLNSHGEKTTPDPTRIRAHCEGANIVATCGPDVPWNANNRLQFTLADAKLLVSELQNAINHADSK